MTSKEIIKNIDTRLSELEEIVIDNQDILIKLVHQGNKIVEFLKTFEDDDDEPVVISHKLHDNKINHMVDKALKINDGLKEFEKQLEKHKDELTPGQVGEA